MPGPVPPDFGGFVGAWSDDGHAFIARIGNGQPQEGLTLTPLNLLQAHALLGRLIEKGAAEGRITGEHYEQADQLPPASIADTPPRADVEKIIGSE